MCIKVVWKVITLNDKQKIILHYIKDNISQREIFKKTGISRDTIRKYTQEYESNLQALGHYLTDIEKIDLIDDITNKPKYKSSERSKCALTDEVLDRLNGFLRENEKKD